MSHLLAYLSALLRRLEHRAVGDVDAVMAPLKRMHEDLLKVHERSHEAALKTEDQIDVLLDHSSALRDKARAALRQSDKLRELLG